MMEKIFLKGKKKLDGYDIKVYNQNDIEVAKLKLNNLIGDNVTIKS